jgi:MFS family permease
MTAVASKPPVETGLGRRYSRLWSAAVLSGLGDGLEVAALPLLAAGLTRDPRLVAGLSAAATLPWLVFGLVSGAIVDRCDRARLMVRVNVARTVLVASLAVMVATRTARIEVVYVLVFLLGVGETLFNTAAQAVLPAIVSTEQLETANGRLEVGELVTETFVGPPVGALIFAAMAALPFAIDAASFAVAAVLLQGLVTPRLRSVAGTSGPGLRPPGLRPPGLRPLYQQLLSDIGEGLRWLLRHRLLRSLCVVMGLANFAVYLTQGILVLFAVERLHVSRHYYGFLLTGIAIGGIAGGFLARRVSARIGPARAILATLAVNVAVDMVVGSLSNALAVTVMLSFAGFVTTLWNVVTISLRQAIIPKELLGRVNSAYRMVGLGAMPLGAVAGGVLSEAYGLRAPFFLAAGITGLALLIAAHRVTPAAIDQARAGALWEQEVRTQ